MVYPGAKLAKEADGGDVRGLQQRGALRHHHQLAPAGLEQLGHRGAAGLFLAPHPRHGSLLTQHVAHDPRVGVRLAGVGERPAGQLLGRVQHHIEAVPVASRALPGAMPRPLLGAGTSTRTRRQRRSRRCRPSLGHTRLVDYTCPRRPPGKTSGTQVDPAPAVRSRRHWEKIAGECVTNGRGGADGSHVRSAHRPHRAGVGRRLAVWLVVWLVLGVVVWRDIGTQARLSQSVVQVGGAVKQTGDALALVGAVPLVGAGIRDLEAACSATAPTCRPAGAREQAIHRVAVIAGLAVAVLPAAMVLLLYLPSRLLWRRDRRAVEAALRDRDDAALDQYLARRAIAALSWTRLRALSTIPGAMRLRATGATSPTRSWRGSTCNGRGEERSPVASRRAGRRERGTPGRAASRGGRRRLLPAMLLGVLAPLAALLLALWAYFRYGREPAPAFTAQYLREPPEPPCRRRWRDSYGTAAAWTSRWPWRRCWTSSTGAWWTLRRSLRRRPILRKRRDRLPHDPARGAGRGAGPGEADLLDLLFGGASGRDDFDVSELPRLARADRAAWVARYSAWKEGVEQAGVRRGYLDADADRWAFWRRRPAFFRRWPSPPPR